MPKLHLPLGPGSPLYSLVLRVRDPWVWRVVNLRKASGPEPKVPTGEKDDSEAPKTLCPAEVPWVCLGWVQ